MSIIHIPLIFSMTSLKLSSSSILLPLELDITEHWLDYLLKKILPFILLPLNKSLALIVLNSSLK